LAIQATTTVVLYMSSIFHAVSVSLRCQDTLFFRYVSFYFLHMRVYFTAFVTHVHTRRRHRLWHFEHYEHISDILSAKRKLNLESSMIFWYTTKWGTKANASLLCDDIFCNCK
jgi:hypothetical protein